MIHLNVQASDPAQLEGMWDWLRGCQAKVDIVDGEMHITVDLGQPGTLALVEALPDETVAAASGSEVAPEYATVETGTEELDLVHAAQVRRDEIDHPDSEPVAGTCEDAIVRYLEANDGISFSPTEIGQALPQFQQSTVAFTLAQLAKKNRIHRPRRGQYEAS